MNVFATTWGQMSHNVLIIVAISKNERLADLIYQKVRIFGCSERGGRIRIFCQEIRTANSLTRLKVDVNHPEKYPPAEIS
jgi:hypothetical protein